MKLNKKRWFILAFIVGIIIVIPPVFFTIKFFSVSISNDVSDWGAFGDFIGGILNPIIALTGTIILGMLTYQISKQSADENKNLFLYEQRILAYQRVSFLLNDVHAASNCSQSTKWLVERLKEIGDDERVKAERIQNYQSLLVILSKINIELEYFPFNYGHLFKYDFTSKKYTSLKNLSHKFFDSFEDSKFDAKTLSFDFQTGVGLMTELEEFVLNLKSEIKI